MPHSRLGILTSHPIQYQAPWFRELARHPEIDLSVFFMSDQSLRVARDPGFCIDIAWDIPLLEGYKAVFLKNVSSRPRVDSFNGADTPEIQDIIKEGKFDAFLITGWYLKSYWQAARACFDCRLPLLIRSEANLLAPRPWMVKIAKRLILGWLFKRTAAFLTVGKLNAYFYKKYGADPSRFFRSPYCVDNDFFAKGANEARRNRGTLRERCGLPQDAFVFLYSGKLSPKKRPMDALRALATVGRGDRRTNNLPWLLMVGDGPLREQCEEYTRNHNLPVRFAGFLNQSEIAAAYAACDCLLMPSDYHETWGLSVNEAMACGLPAIVSDRVGCGPDLIVSGKTGFVFKCEDLAELAVRMEWCTLNHTEVARIGLEAQKHISQYSIGHTVYGILAALERIHQFD